MKPRRRALRHGLRLFGRAARQRFRPGALILMYHRVAEVDQDPWTMAVSPSHFAQQLDVLRRWTRPMSLPEMVTLASEGRLPDRAVAITFDDGYVDNLTHALPLLEERHLPATVFVTAASKHNIREFWWDRLESILMSPSELPVMLEMEIGGRKVRRYAAASDAATYRSTLHLDLWNALQPLPHHERATLLDELADWAGAPQAYDAGRRPMTDDELREFGQSTCITIGAHTVTHPLLTALTVPEQFREIVDSKDHLERILGQPVTTFSFPFGGDGGLGRPLQPLVRQAGFCSACTSEVRTIRGSQDPYRLPRYVVGDWPGRTFSYQLASWFMG